MTTPEWLSLTEQHRAVECCGDGDVLCAACVLLKGLKTWPLQLRTELLISLNFNLF